MGALLNSIVGLSFLGVAVVLTFLMFHLWKYPFDKERHVSSAPVSLMRLHRFLGYVYVLLYLYLMWQMVPRLWAYQIELPARTVFHLTLGMSIGAILIIKISIVRYFKHLEAKLVPFLGVALLVATMLLIFLALPFSLREAYLSATALDSNDAVSKALIARVKEQLPAAGIEDPAIIEQVASREGLDRGRVVLQTKCTQCHDLRTALAKPRTPANWKQTVSRMANRSTVLNPITEQDELEVTTYLIAISPTLQKSIVERRKQVMQMVEDQQSSLTMTREISNSDSMGEFDAESAKEVFQQTCSQCHSYAQVENAPPRSKDEAVALVQRMIGNGLQASDDQISQIVKYLVLTYAPSDMEQQLSENSDSDVDENEDENGEEGEDEEYEDDEEDEEADPISSIDPIAVAALDGSTLYNQYGCVGCHGASGAAPIATNYPKLTGQNRTYLIRQLIDIRDGNRVNGLSGVMLGVVNGMSDIEFAAIAEYLTAQ